jgi:hypothetical protein
VLCNDDEAALLLTKRPHPLICDRALAGEGGRTWASGVHTEPRMFHRLGIGMPSGLFAVSKFDCPLSMGPHGRVVGHISNFSRHILAPSSLSWYACKPVHPNMVLRYYQTAGNHLQAAPNSDGGV